MHKQPIVELDDDKINGAEGLTVDQRKEMVARCPKKVYKFNEIKQTVDIEDVNKCNLCTECSRYTDSLKVDKAVKLDEDDNKFYFTIESTGALPPVEIVRKAFQILKKKIATFDKELTQNVYGSMGNAR